MTIPLAVSPSDLLPGLSLVVNLLASVASPGSAALKGAIMAPRSAAGTLTPDTEIRAISGEDDALLTWGPKTPGYLAAVAFFQEYPTGTLFGVAPTESAGASASKAYTFAGTPSAAYNAAAEIGGPEADIPWAAGETPDTFIARAITYINARNDMPATASTSGTGVLVLTFPVKGPWGNDCPTKFTLQGGVGSTVNGGSSAAGNLTGGTTEPDFTTALTTMSGQRYDFILVCVSNADAASASTTSNPGRLKTAIASLNTGNGAKLQRGIVGCTGALASAKTGAIARNDVTLEYVFTMNGRSLPSQWGGAELGSRMRDIQDKPAKNRINTPFVATLFGAADLVADTPTPAERRDAIGNGITIVSYDAQGNPLLVRPVTTHSQDSLGNPDRRCMDTAGVDGMYAVANDIQLFLPQEFPGVNVARDLQPGEEPLPEGVVEERDIKTAIVTRLRFWQQAGVVRKDKLDAAIADGSLIVQVNASDESQVDIVIPLAIYRWLAKFGVVLNKVA